MPAKAARAAKPDTAMSAAFDAVGIKTVAGRLDDAVMAAAQKHPDDRRQAIEAFLAAIQGEADLLWELMGDRRGLLAAQRFDATMTALRELEEERQREEAAKKPHKRNGSGGGGHGRHESQDRSAPVSGTGRAQAFGSYAERRPSGSYSTTLLDRQRQKDRVTAAAKFEREALWDSYLIHKQPLRTCSLGLIRSTTRIRGVEHRWFQLLGKAQAMDTMKIEDVWTAEQVEALYAQAKREYVGEAA